MHKDLKHAKLPLLPKYPGCFLEYLTKSTATLSTRALPTQPIVFKITRAISIDSAAQAPFPIPNTSPTFLPTTSVSLPIPMPSEIPLNAFVAAFQTLKDHGQGIVPVVPALGVKVMDDVIPCVGNNATGFRIMMVLQPDLVESLEGWEAGRPKLSRTRHYPEL